MESTEGSEETPQSEPDPRPVSRTASNAGPRLANRAGSDDLDLDMDAVLATTSTRNYTASFRRASRQDEMSSMEGTMSDLEDTERMTINEDDTLQQMSSTMDSIVHDDNMTLNTLNTARDDGSLEDSGPHEPFGPTAFESSRTLNVMQDDAVTDMPVIGQSQGPYYHMRTHSNSMDTIAETSLAHAAAHVELMEADVEPAPTSVDEDDPAAADAAHQPPVVEAPAPIASQTVESALSVEDVVQDEHQSDDIVMAPHPQTPAPAAAPTAQPSAPVPDDDSSSEMHLHETLHKRTSVSKFFTFEDTDITPVVSVPATPIAAAEPIAAAVPTPLQVPVTVLEATEVDPPTAPAAPTPVSADAVPSAVPSPTAAAEPAPTGVLTPVAEPTEIVPAVSTDAVVESTELSAVEMEEPLVDPTPVTTGFVLPALTLPADEIQSGEIHEHEKLTRRTTASHFEIPVIEEEVQMRGDMPMPTTQPSSPSSNDGREEDDQHTPAPDPLPSPVRLLDRGASMRSLRSMGSNTSMTSLPTLNSPKPDELEESHRVEDWAVKQTPVAATLLATVHEAAPASPSATVSTPVTQTTPPKETPRKETPRKETPRGGTPRSKSEVMDSPQKLIKTMSTRNLIGSSLDLGDVGVFAALEEIPLAQVKKAEVSTSSLQLDAAMENHPVQEVEYSKPMRRLQRGSTVKSFMEPKSSIEGLLDHSPKAVSAPENAMAVAAKAAAQAAECPGSPNSAKTALSANSAHSASLISVVSNKSGDSAATKTSPNKARIGVSKLRSLVLGVRDEETGPVDDFEAARKNAQQVAERLQKMKEEQQKQLQEREAAKKKKMEEDARNEADLAARYGKARSLGFSSIKVGLTKKEYDDFHARSPVKPLMHVLQEHHQRMVEQQALFQHHEHHHEDNADELHSHEHAHIAATVQSIGLSPKDDDAANFPLSNRPISLPAVTPPSGKTVVHPPHSKRLSIARTRRGSFGDQGPPKPVHHVEKTSIEINMDQFEHEIVELLQELQADDLIDKRFGWNRKPAENHHNININQMKKLKANAPHPKMVMTTSLDSLTEIMTHAPRMSTTTPNAVPMRRNSMVRQRSLRKARQTMRDRSFDQNNPPDANFIPGFDEESNNASIFTNYSGLIYRDPSTASAWKEINESRERSVSPPMSRRTLNAGRMLNAYRPWSRPKTPDFDPFFQEEEEEAAEEKRPEVTPSAKKGRKNKNKRPSSSMSAGDEQRSSDFNGSLSMGSEAKKRLPLIITIINP